jgi:hypothetical protein
MEDKRVMAGAETEFPGKNVLFYAIPHKHAQGRDNLNVGFDR